MNRMPSMSLMEIQNERTEKLRTRSNELHQNNMLVIVFAYFCGLSFEFLSYYVSLGSEFHVVRSVTIYT